MRIEDKEKPAYLLGYAYGEVSLLIDEYTGRLIFLHHNRLHEHHLFCLLHNNGYF
jgi:hypothetical protein